MRPVDPAEFPPDVERAYRRAVRLEWVSLAYVVSGSIALYLTMGTSQAMRTTFFDDVVSLVPSLAFLIGTRVARRRTGDRYPYGMHRATSIAHLVSAVALCAMGLFLAGEALVKGLSGERATIGGVRLFGTTVWAGWPMLAAIVYTTVPSAILGRIKARLAPTMYDKVLHAQANMMKADWMGEAATAVGVIGAGFGLWWLDPLAAFVVSLEILHDGVENLGTAVGDLVHRRPRTTDDTAWEVLPDRVRDLFRGLDWVEDVGVRMREEGHVFFGDVLVVPRPGTPDLVGRVADAVERARKLDWRVHELVVMPVERLPEPRGR